MVMFEFFDPLFDPLLEIGAFWAIFVISLTLSVIITIIYKLMTDQKEMKELKAKTKEYQKEMKTLKDNPKKMMQIQKESMSINSKYMMKSMKPTLVTFLPIIIIFGWLGANLAYEPIQPDDSFDLALKFKDAMNEELTLTVPEGIDILNGENKSIVNNYVKWELKAKKIGIYQLSFKYNGKQYMQKIKVSNEIGEYEKVEQKISDGSPLKSIKTIIPQVRPMGDFTLFGWKPNWLWTYIIFSMIFSLGLRKALKLH